LELEGEENELDFKDRIVNQPYTRIAQACKLPIATHTKRTSDIDGFVIHQRGYPLGPGGNIASPAKVTIGKFTDSWASR